MNKWTVIHPGNGIVFSSKKKQAIKPGKDTEEVSVHIGKGKKPEANLKRLPTV